tara:strand:+ start:7349 stop:7768 length:420 start_codon:yes stop_codon:yes gene_type:complete
MEVPENIVNPSLYRKARKIADETYKRHGLFKSAFIQKKYQELGGKYKGSKPKETTGIQRWLKGEKWIKVLPYVKEGKIVDCGSGDDKHACRPMKRVNKKTPITIDEVIEKHGKKKVIELANMKRKDLDVRINWNTGKKI